MHRSHPRISAVAVLLGLLLALVSSSAVAQYKANYLDSDLSGTKHTEPLLLNPWGLAYAPGGAFWISDEASGYSTLYDGHGNPQSLQVVVPSASGSGIGSPTGIVYNGSQEFKIRDWISAFMFSTLDGTISGWSDFSPSLALIGVTNPGAAYTGLAITNYPSGNSIFAADAAGNKVDIYNGNFELTGTFTDPTIPATFSPFGIQDIGGQVYIAYAATNGGPGGYIDIMTEQGVFVKRFARGQALNQPWGMAVAPADFGKFSHALLVTNNTNTGTVIGYNLKTGQLLGTLSDASGNPILINGIWGIEFGGGTPANGATNQLYFTAGPNDYDGLFGVINSLK